MGATHEGTASIAGDVTQATIGLLLSVVVARVTSAEYACKPGDGSGLRTVVDGPVRSVPLEVFVDARSRADRGRDTARSGSATGPHTLRSRLRP